MERIPTRMGRCAGFGDWRAQYQALQMTAEEAAALVHPGDVLAMTGAGSWPAEIDVALAARLLAKGDRIEVNSHFQLMPYALLAPELREQVRFRSNFFVGERRLQRQGNVEFCPTHLSETGAWAAARNPRVAIITCAPPDTGGWMSRGLWGSQIPRKLLESCEVVIAEVNDQMPSFYSEGEAHMGLHVSEVDAIVKSSRLPPQSPGVPADDTDRKIAGYIADLVPDGGCVQFGIGGLANAIGEELVYAGKRDLGMQSEVISDCVVDLMERGVLNNSRKETCPGRSVGAFFIGGQRLWDFASENPAFCHKEIEWVNDSRNIARNRKVVSINNAMEIDLTGQVNAETAGGRQYSGTGGQLEWVIGAQWSPGGKSIIALRSAYRDKTGTLRSKILPQLARGSVVTTPRTWVQYVVTEYGVADLKYKSNLERAKALIAIAHPDFREELRRQMNF